ncbi:MAG: Rpn family recombination-promoting nuclease/putative transposase [Lachnospiraceae bacterium]|nr:Rpn family recombination-promoting nuclease/putative transposase [Lachnospiraceae bacterium]
MGRNENAFIPFLKQAKEFADLFNGFIFGGAQVILPENLSPLPESLRSNLRDKAGAFDTVVRYRDIGMMAQIGTLRFLLVCAVEHQTYLDYSMPHRMMEYEAMEYHEQLEKITRVNKDNGKLPSKYYISGVTLEDKLIPVITIVIYSGDEKWEGARCLHDFLKLDGIPEDALPHIGNWPLNMIDLNEPIDTSKYHSDLRLLFELAKRRKDKRAVLNYIREHEEFKTLGTLTCYMLSQYLNVNIEPDDYKNTDKGGINMCNAIQELMEDARLEGIEQGLAQGTALGKHEQLMSLVQLKYDKGKNLSQIADECETTEENILSIMEEMKLVF